MPQPVLPRRVPQLAASEPESAAKLVRGWLTEGWELEPTPEERERVAKIGAQKASNPSTVEIQEPEVRDP